MHVTIIFNHGGLIICHLTLNAIILTSPNEQNKSIRFHIFDQTSPNMDCMNTPSECAAVSSFIVNENVHLPPPGHNFFGSGTEVSFREGERWIGDATAVGNHEHQCMLLANRSPTAPKHRLAGWRSQLPSNYISYIQKGEKKHISKVDVGIRIMKIK